MLQKYTHIFVRDKREWAMWPHGATHDAGAHLVKVADQGWPLERLNFSDNPGDRVFWPLLKCFSMSLEHLNEVAAECTRIHALVEPSLFESLVVLGEVPWLK
jgi:hypothetical protein